MQKYTTAVQNLFEWDQGRSQVTNNKGSMCETYLWTKFTDVTPALLFHRITRPSNKVTQYYVQDIAAKLVLVDGDVVYYSFNKLLWLPAKNNNENNNSG